VLSALIRCSGARHVARTNEVADLLLQLNQLVVKLSVELIGLLEVFDHLFLIKDDCIVQLIEVVNFRSVHSWLSKDTFQGRSV